MDTISYSINIGELVNKATELVEDGMGCAHGQIRVQQIMIGDIKYNLSVVIEATDGE